MRIGYVTKTGAALVALALWAGTSAAHAQVPSQPPHPQTAPGSWTVEVDTGTKPTGPAPIIKMPTVAEVRLRRIQAASRWAYQLRLIDPNQIRNSPFDLVVIDHAISAFRRFVREFTPDEIATLRQRPDGSTRIALSYLSIGEAERYRFYWRQDWYEAAKKPGWLGELNPQWDGNYAVKFWDPAWQSLDRKSVV